MQSGGWCHDNIAKMFNVSSQHLQNPAGRIHILIELESASLWLRELHYVNDLPVHKTFFTRDLMLSNSSLTKKMVVKGAIGGQKFGQNNSIYYSDSQPANLLRTLSVQDSSFQFNQAPSQEDIQLLPKDARISQSSEARISNPISSGCIIPPILSQINSASIS